MRGRERVLTRQLVVRVPSDLDDWLTAVADADGRTKAQTVRWMLQMIRDHGLRR